MGYLGFLLFLIKKEAKRGGGRGDAGVVVQSMHFSVYQGFALTQARARVFVP
jgi:hypothetical protein